MRSSEQPTFNIMQLFHVEHRASCYVLGYMYVASVCSLAKSLAAELDVLRTELRGRLERRAKHVDI